MGMNGYFMESRASATPRLPNMPSYTLDSGITFTYTDSGAVRSNKAYTTLVFIHGHTFHAGTFQRLLPIAAANGLRVLCINRREYAESNLYTDEELDIFASGTQEQRAALLAGQGRDLALCVDGLIQRLRLPKAGGVALIGWSLGATFLCSILASIESLPAPAKKRLVDHVHTTILFQAPSVALGIPLPSTEHLPIPHTDPTIAPADRPAAFARWVSAFFAHGDLSTRSLSALTYHPAAEPTPTLARMSAEEVASMVDYAPGQRYDDAVGLPQFAGVVKDIVQRALWDGRVRNAWRRLRPGLGIHPTGGASGGGLWVLYGTAEVWNVIQAAWVLEDEAKMHPQPGMEMRFAVMQGVNHFLVWEDAQAALDALKQCIPRPAHEGLFTKLRRVFRKLVGAA
ncbi:AB hydrolase-1 domain-containing protein [Mycena kentingensis (nom. inval.)]|nr:AB hydrolase-1 domain-containing protein [Mycena kentingensis (nom. inval.)]